MFNSKKFEGIFCAGKNAKSSRASSKTQVYCETLNLIFSASKQNIKIWLVTLELSMWGLCIPNFSPLASTVWEEEEEVTDERMDVKHS